MRAYTVLAPTTGANGEPFSCAVEGGMLQNPVLLFDNGASTVKAGMVGSDLPRGVR